MKLEEQDWHGVMDAAADLREIDANNVGRLQGAADQRKADQERANQRATSSSINPNQIT
jgi:hypothetical protein